MKFVLVITFALLASLVFTLDFSALGRIFANVNVFLLALSLIPVGLEISLKSARLHQLAATVGRVRIADAFIVTLVGFPFATVTPARSGDLIKVYSLSQKASLPLSKGFALGVFEKILDLVSLFLLVSLAIGALALQGVVASPLLSVFLLMGGVGALIAVSMNKKLINAFLRYAWRKFLPLKYQGNAETAFENFYAALEAILAHKKKLGVVLALALFLWANRVLHVLLFALALGVDVQLQYFFFVIPLTFVAEILPISVMGLGVREYTFILLFSLLGINAETAVAISLMVFTIGILPPAIIGYFVALKEYGGAASIKNVLQRS